MGVELAGEIAVDYPKKKVTVVHSQEELIDNRLSAKFQRKLQAEMKNRGIDIVLGEKVDMSELDVSCFRRNLNISLSCTLPLHTQWKNSLQLKMLSVSLFSVALSEFSANFSPYTASSQL